MARRSRSRLTPIGLLRTRATSKGLLGGGPTWRAVWAVLIGGRVLRKQFGRTPDLLIDEPLEPGETMVIRTIPAPTRAERKAAKRARRSR